MRRFTVFPLALLLAFVLAAPVAAGANVTNQSGTFDVANGYWYSYDEATGVDSSGGIQVAQADGQTYFDLYDQSGAYVDCSTGLPAKGGVTTKDTTGGGYGFKGTQSYAMGGEPTVSFGRRLSGVTASGAVDVVTYAIDDCAGTYDLVKEGNETLALALTGTGPVISFKDTSSIRIPAALNGHASESGDYRAATGTVDFGRGSRAIVDGQIAHVTWRNHCNGTC
jgi:hypothetical protein